MQDEPLNLDNLKPEELDDAELLLLRTKIRAELYQAVMYDSANISPELTSRYRALNAEVAKRTREAWS
jgi:hypothetical protein